MELQLPLEGTDLLPQGLNARQVKYIARQLEKVEKSLEANMAGRIATGVDPLHNERDETMEEKRKAIHEKYDRIVLGTEVYPDPPERGPFGMAYIPLKENATRGRQKPFVMHGERFGGPKKVVEDWIAKNFIERPREECKQNVVDNFCRAEKRK